VMCDVHWSFKLVASSEPDFRLIPGGLRTQNFGVWSLREQPLYYGVFEFSGVVDKEPFVFLGRQCLT
jgi:hypothetical protein